MGRRRRWSSDELTTDRARMRARTTTSFRVNQLGRPFVDFSEVCDHVAQQCDFPIDHEALVKRIGDVELDAPRSESETIGDVLSRTGETAYRSADDVHNTLLGTVGDAYIGPKYYDERGGARSIPRDRPIESV